MGFFEKLKAGLSKTKKALFGGIEDLFKRFRHVDEDLFDELEELLITSDVGVETTEELLDALRDHPYALKWLGVPSVDEIASHSMPILFASRTFLPSPVTNRFTPSPNRSAVWTRPSSCSATSR